MAIRTRTDIKSFFQTGDKPTSGNYGDFIESTIFLNTTNTGSLNLQGTGSFEGGINCIPSDGEGSTGSFGMVSASGDISASGGVFADALIIKDTLAIESSNDSLRFNEG